MTVFALGAGILAGCNDSDKKSSADYCAAVKDLGGGSYVPNTASSEIVPKMRNVVEVAPDEIESGEARFADAQDKPMSGGGYNSTTSMPPDIGQIAQRIVTFSEKTCMKRVGPVPSCPPLGPDGISLRTGMGRPSKPNSISDDYR
ncbi:hypothetical protein [Nocardia sp. NPDC057440]|uniref:hypothetical protein n=1 Tax=Nocardia sp. NPDC057440 TaxID=3346134 RepID=UPI00366F338E